MKGPFVYGPGDLRVDDIERPHAGRRDVVLQIATVGTCRGDLGYTAVGGIAGRGGNPIPLGHELSGVIACPNHGHARLRWDELHVGPPGRHPAGLGRQGPGSIQIIANCSW